MRRIMNTRAAIALAALAGGFCVQSAHAQDGPGPLTTDTKFWYTTIKGFVIKAAEKMPEENYSFRPTDSVRTFGQIVGHVADDQYFFCSAVKGESKPSEIEKTVKGKAALVAKLKEAFAYCDGVYDGFSDAHATEKIKTFAGDRTKLSILNFNYAHSYEHYGNIVTYMRIKGLVPPSSEGSN
jgi:uncharacterized damage-inducible protein DinB